MIEGRNYRWNRLELGKEKIGLGIISEDRFIADLMVTPDVLYLHIHFCLRLFFLKKIKPEMTESIIVIQ